MFATEYDGKMFENRKIKSALITVQNQVRYNVNFKVYLKTIDIKCNSMRFFT